MARSKTTFKKGDPNINRKGAPKIPDDIKSARKLTKMELEKVLNKYMYTDMEELKQINNNPKTPMIDKFVISIIVKGIQNGDERRLNFLLERLVGKVKEEIRVEDVTPFSIIYPDGKKQILGVK